MLAGGSAVDERDAVGARHCENVRGAEREHVDAVAEIPGGALSARGCLRRDRGGPEQRAAEGCRGEPASCGLQHCAT